MHTTIRRRAVVAGLALLALTAACGSSDSSSADAGAPGNAAQAARTVDIKTTATGYQPSSITVAKGETVTFKVTNDDTVLHEFVVGNSKTQDDYGKTMSDMSAGQTMLMPDSTNVVDVEPGQTKQLTWTFPSAATKVVYGSHQPNDYKKFKGTITVK